MPAQITRLSTATTGSNQTRLHESLEALNNFLGISGDQWNNVPGVAPGKGFDQVQAFDGKLLSAAGGSLVDILQVIDNFDFSGGTDLHFAGTNLSSTGNRTHSFAGHSLTINNATAFNFNGVGINTLQGTVAAKFISSNTSLGGATQFFGGSSFNSNYVGIKAPDNLGNTQNYVLPNALPAVSGYVLSSTTGGVMSWVENGSGADTNFAEDDLTANGARVHEWGGNSLTINNMSTFMARANTTYNMQATNQVTTFSPVVRLKSLAGSASAPALTFTEADASVDEHWISFAAPDELAGNSSYTWPAALPAASGYALTCTTGGVMSWSATGGADTHLGNTALAADASYSHNWGNFNLTFTSVGQLDLTTTSGSNFLFAGAAQFTTFSMDILNDTPTSGGQLNLFEATTHTGGNFVGIQGPDANMASSYTIELPAAGPTTNGQALSVASGGGTANVLMEWTTPAGGADFHFFKDDLTASSARLHSMGDNDLTINSIQTLLLRSGLFYFRSSIAIEPAAIDLFEAEATGNDYVRLAAQASVLNTYTIEWPETFGAAGQVLSVQSFTPGANVHTLEWTTPAAGGADTNFAEDNLTANGNRTHNWADLDLTLNSVNQFQINTTSGGQFTFGGAATLTTFALSLVGDVSTNPGVIQFYEPSQFGPVNFVGFEAPSSNIAASYSMTLPAVTPSANGQFLKVASGAGGSAPVLEFGDELNRKEGADNLGTVSGAVNIDFDTGSFDNKRVTVNGTTTFSVAMSAREGRYAIYLAADGTTRDINWSVAEDTESIRPEHIAANDTMVIWFEQRGGVYSISTSGTTRQLIDGTTQIPTSPTTWNVDVGGVYRTWQVTGDIGHASIFELPDNMPANSTLEVEFSSSQSVAPSISSNFVRLSPVATHNGRSIYVIRRTDSTYYFCAGDAQ